MKKKQTIKLNESQLKNIVKETIKMVLKEQYSDNTFKDGLKERFEEKFKNLFLSEANDLKHEFGWVDNDFCEEYAYDAAERTAEDCLTLINSNNWNYPQNNFLPFGFVMKHDYNINTKEDLLKREDAVDIVFDWFFDCFGTYNLCYNFTNDYSEHMVELNGEDED